MSDIVLTTLNAKYIHAAFGLRYLLANLGDLRPRAALLEFDLNSLLVVRRSLFVACPDGESRRWFFVCARAHVTQRAFAAKLER